MEVDNGPCPLTIVLQWNGHVMVISCMQLSQSEKDPHVCVCVVGITISKWNVMARPCTILYPHRDAR